MNRLVLLENSKTSTDLIDRLTRENKELKNNVQKLLQTVTTFMAETNDKFLDYDAAIVDLENKFAPESLEEMQENIVIDSTTTLINNDEEIINTEENIFLEKEETSKFSKTMVVNID